MYQRVADTEEDPLIQPDLKNVDPAVIGLIQQEDERATTREAVTAGGFRLPCLSDETPKEKLARLLQDCEIMPDDWRETVKKGSDEQEQRDSGTFAVAVKEVEATIKVKIVKAWEAPFKDRWCRVLALFVMFVTERTPLLVEVSIVLAAYYSDVVLDVMMMRTFLGYHDYWFFNISIFGIVMGLFYGVLEMCRQLHDAKDDVQEAYGGSQARRNVQILVIGCLLPLQLHMMAIGFISLWEGNAHMFLYTSKLAESVVESTISGCVQTYALIYREMSGREMTTGYLSIGLSYFSMAFAFTSFDRRNQGLASVPGVAPGWLWNRFTLCWVLLARLCEVTSRITFIGLFQRAMRDETMVGRFPVGILVGADGLLMFIMILVFQADAYRKYSNKGAFLFGLRSAAQYSIPSTIAFINPMIASSNVCSVPFKVYYFVRLSEILLMVTCVWKIEVYHGPLDGASINGTVLDPFDGNEKNNLYGLSAFMKEFEDDHLIIGAFMVSTILWLIIGPLLRRCACDEIMLLDREMLYNEPFTPLKDMLCSQLLVVKPPMMRCNYFPGKLGLRRSIEFSHVCSEVLEQKLMQLKKEVALRRHVSLGRSTSMVSTRKPDMPVEAQPLWLWKWSVTRLSQEIDKEHTVVPPLPKLLQELVHLGYNVGHYLKCRPNILDLDCLPRLQELQDQKKRIYLEYLQGLNCILRDVETQERFRDMRAIEMVLRVLPAWPPLGEQWLKAEIQTEKRIFIEKCELLVNCLRLGWRIHGAAFHSLALRLMTAFDARPVHGNGGIKEIVGEKDSRFICIAQFLALIKVWVAMGSDVIVPMGWQAKLFRRQYEVQCFCDGVAYQMDLRGEEGVRTEGLRNRKIGDSYHRNEFLHHVDNNLMYRDRAQQDDEFPDRLKLSTKLDFLEEVLNATRLRAVGIEKIVGGVKKDSLEVTSLAELHREVHSINFEAETCSVKLVGLKELGKLSKDAFRERMKRKDIRLNETVMLQFCNAVDEEDLNAVMQITRNEEEGSITRQDTAEFKMEVRSALEDISKVKETLVADCLSVLGEYVEHLRIFRELEVDPRTAIAYDKFRETMNKAREKKGEMPKVEDIGSQKRHNFNALHEFEEVYEGFKVFLRSVRRHFGADHDMDLAALDQSAANEGSMHGMLSLHTHALREFVRRVSEGGGKLWSSAIQEECKLVYIQTEKQYKELREVVTEYWGEQEQTISTRANEMEISAQQQKKAAEQDRQVAKNDLEQAKLEKAHALGLLQQAEIERGIEAENRKKAEDQVKEAQALEKQAHFEEKMAKQTLEEVKKEKLDLIAKQEEAREEARKATFKLEQQRQRILKEVEKLKTLSHEEQREQITNIQTETASSADCNLM